MKFFLLLSEFSGSNARKYFENNDMENKVKWGVLGTAYIRCEMTPTSVGGE